MSTVKNGYSTACFLNVNQTEMSWIKKRKKKGILCVWPSVKVIATY